MKAHEFAETADRLLGNMLDLGIVDHDRTGGYLTILEQWPTDWDVPVLVALVGEIPNKKSRKYRDFSFEKAKRLMGHSEHLSSWQSRSPNEDRWGGAVRTDTHILSFSGLPELADEALMLALALKLGLLKDRYAATIAMTSDNNDFRRLFGEVDLTAS